MTDEGNRHLQRERQTRAVFPRYAPEHYEAPDPREQDKGRVADQEACPQKMDVAEIALKENRRQQQDLVDDRKEIQEHEKGVAGPGPSDPDSAVEYHFEEPVGIPSLFPRLLLKRRAGVLREFQPGDLRVFPVVPHPIDAYRHIEVFGDLVLRPPAAFFENGFADEHVMTNQRNEETLQGPAGPCEMKELVGLVSRRPGVIILPEIDRVRGALNIRQLVVKGELRCDRFDDPRGDARILVKKQDDLMGPAVAFGIAL